VQNTPDLYLLEGTPPAQPQRRGTGEMAPSQARRRVARWVKASEPREHGVCWAVL